MPRRLNIQKIVVYFLHFWHHNVIFRFMEGRNPSRLLRALSLITLFGIPAATKAASWGIDVRDWPSNTTSYQYFSSRFGSSFGSRIMGSSPSSAGGTMDNTGLATFVSGSATQVDGSESSTASATADMSTATLTDQHSDDSGAAGGFEEGRTLVEIADVLTFTNPTAGPSDVTTVPYTLTVSGSMAVNAPGIFGTPNNSLSVDFFADSISFDTASISVGLDSTTGYLPTVTPGDGTWTYSDASLMTYNGDLTFTGTSGSHFVLLEMDSSGTAVASDYSMSMSIGTPSDVAMTSASGAFLVAAPEPASIMALAVGLPIAMQRRRRSA
jgi:hypothetical protein